MYEFSESTIIKADLARAWAITTDVNAWPSWDPHEVDARINGPFEVGTVGWSKPNGGPATEWTITEVTPLQRWASECPLPGGKITGVNAFTKIDDDRIQCTKTIRVFGPLAVLFRWYFGRKMRKDMHKTWAALERRCVESMVS